MEWNFAVVFANDSHAEPVYFMDAKAARDFMREQGSRETVLYRRGGEVIAARSQLYGWKEYLGRGIRRPF